MNSRQLNNQRQRKIEYIKSIMEGTRKPLDGQTLLWDKEDGVWQCTMKDFKHLRFATDEDLKAFTKRYGGHHIMFCSFSSDDEPIVERETPNRTIPDPIEPEVFKWQEQKTYEVEQPTIEPEFIAPSIPEPVMPETKKPKKERKERKQRTPKVNPVEARKAKLKADHVRVLAQIAQDQKRIESMNNYKWINREFL